MIPVWRLHSRVSNLYLTARFFPAPRFVRVNFFFRYMTMKHFCILLIFSMTAVLSAAATQPAATAKPAETKPAATTTAKPAEAAKPTSVLTSIYRTNPEPSAFADPEKAEKLLNSRAELVQKIQDERKRILQEDASAKKLRDEIMLLNRKLASLLESKKSMIELNSQLLDLDLAISRLKPAPPPPPEPKAEDEDKKADTADKTTKTDKADTADKKAAKKDKE